MPRPRKASLVKAAEGNRAKLGKAKIKTDPPARGTLRVPEGMSEEALTIWKDVVGSLPVGLLARVDEGALERYAKAYARWRAIDQQLEYEPDLIQGRFGLIVNPLYRLLAQYAKEMDATGGVLGCSPVARAKLATTASQPTDADPMALVLGDGADTDDAWSVAPRTQQ
jgi:P27 family predicted phage terminase small subunit